MMNQAFAKVDIANMEIGRKVLLKASNGEMAVGLVSNECIFIGDGYQFFRNGHKAAEATIVVDGVFSQDDDGYVSRVVFAFDFREAEFVYL